MSLESIWKRYMKILEFFPKTVAALINWRKFWLLDCSYWLKNVKNGDIAINGKPISELRSITCHMGSHNVTCHPTQVNVPRLNPSKIDRYSIYLPRKDGRLSWLRRLITYRDGFYLLAGNHPSKYQPRSV